MRKDLKFSIIGDLMYIWKKEIQLRQVQEEHYVFCILVYLLIAHFGIQYIVTFPFCVNKNLQR